MIIKKPDSGHPKFRLLELINGKHHTRQTPELDGLNNAYLAGHLTVEQAHNRLKDLVRAWTQPSHASIAMSKTELFISRFWEESPKGVKKPRRNQHATRTARSAYFELPRLMPRLDVQTATIEEVRAAIEPFDTEKQRKLCSRINTLWAWDGRPAKEKIPLPQKSRRSIKISYLEPAQIFEIAEKLDGALRLYCLAAFGTGARPGEVFALTKDDFKHKGTHILIDKTWDQKYEEQDTKNRTTGVAFIVKECREAVRLWVEVPEDTKKIWWRKSTHAQPFKVASGGHTPYILRHSYARHMLNLGANLTDLQMWMRSKAKVIEDYYLKWVQTSAEMDVNLKRFG